MIFPIILIVIYIALAISLIYFKKSGKKDTDKLSFVVGVLMPLLCVVTAWLVAFGMHTYNNKQGYTSVDEIVYITEDGDIETLNGSWWVKDETYYYCCNDIKEILFFPVVKPTYEEKEIHGYLTIEEYCEAKNLS